MLRYEGFDFDLMAKATTFSATYCDIDIADIRPLAFLLAGLDHCCRGKKFEPRKLDQIWMRCAQKDKEIYFGLSLDGEGWDWIDSIEAAELRLALQKFFNLLRT
jgi:hypothetical protein